MLRAPFGAALSPGLTTNIQQGVTQPPHLCNHLFLHKVLLLLTRSKSRANPAGSYPATQECILHFKSFTIGNQYQTGKKKKNQILMLRKSHE